MTVKKRDFFLFFRMRLPFYGNIEALISKKRFYSFHF